MGRVYMYACGGSLQVCVMYIR